MLEQHDLQPVNTQMQGQAPITDALYRRFIAYVDAKPKTVETYTRALRQFFYYLEDQGLRYPTREDVLRFRDGLKADHKPATVQNYMVAVRLFFQWTQSEGFYPNVAEGIKGATISRAHKKDYLNSSQIKALLASVERRSLRGKRDYAMLVLMITGGLRTIEVARANIGDMRALGDDTVLYVQGKGQEERTEYVKLTPPVEAAIRDYLHAAKLFRPDQPLFISLSNQNYGQRMTTRTISGIVKTRMERAGYKSDTLSAHSLRHSAVTLSLLGGATLQQAQQFARHASITTTQVYAHNLDRAKNPCEDVIAGAVF